MTRETAHLALDPVHCPRLVPDLPAAVPLCSGEVPDQRVEKHVYNFYHHLDSGTTIKLLTKLFISSSFRVSADLTKDSKLVTDWVTAPGTSGEADTWAGRHEATLRGSGWCCRRLIGEVVKSWRRPLQV